MSEIQQDTLVFYSLTPSPHFVRSRLGMPLEWELVRSYDSPAHSFEGVFPATRDYPELGYVEVWDNGNRLFRGKIDEQAELDDDGGVRLRLLARSLGAVLLDNEARPQTYIGADFQTIFNEHAKPHGMNQLQTEHNPAFYTYKIAKGTSEWEVISRFYTNRGLGTVYVDDQDVVHGALYPFSGTVHRFDNKDPTALPFTSLKMVNNRYSPISKFICKDMQGEYSEEITCPYPLADVQRIRYLDTSPEFADGLHGGMEEARLRMMHALLGKKVFTLTTPGLLRASVCDHADVVSSLGKTEKGLFVHQVRWQVTAAGAVTVLTLLDAAYI